MPQESPKRLLKAPPESSQGTFGRPKGLLGWSWEPQGLILEPQDHFYLFFLLFQTFSSLFSSLFFFIFSRICCSFHPRFFYLFSSPILSARVSLRASLRSIQRFFITGTLNRRNPNISNLNYFTALLLTFTAPPLRNSSWLVC